MLWTWGELVHRSVPLPHLISEPLNSFYSNCAAVSACGEIITMLVVEWTIDPLHSSLHVRSHA